MHMRYFLCQEDDEQFIVEAIDLKEAKERAEVYNAVVVKEVPKKEIYK